MTTFGIEIEIVNDGRYTRDEIAAAICAAGVVCNVEGYGHSTPRNWKIVTDGSVTGSRGTTGFEIVSPILDPRNGDGCYNEIVAVCHALNGLGITVNKTCGFHVHLYVANMSPKNVAAFAARYIRNEHFIDLAMPKSRRANNNAYCRSNIANVVPTDPVQYMRAVNAKLAELRTVRSFSDLTRVLHFRHDRYSKLNMYAFNRQGTIEIRQAAGTTNPQKICMWVRFLLSMLRESNRSTRVKDMTVFLLVPERAWGTFWRYDDRPAILWFCKRLRHFWNAENMTAADAVALAA